ncbi:MAG: hypothetical protein PHD32_02325 [Eubacteriales bacterium]|nr:hypothetical protein [Eubacteriales bacterium]
MTRKSRNFIIITLIVCLMLSVLTGCKKTQVEGVAYQKVDKHTLSFQLAGETWNRTVSGRTVKIYRADTLVGILTGKTLEVTLADGGAMTVHLDQQGSPETVTVPFGTSLTPETYDTVKNACEVNRLGVVVAGNPAGAVVFMLLFLLAGVLLLVFSGKLAKIIKKNGDPTDKKTRNILLLVGGVLTLVGIIILLVLIF